MKDTNEVGASRAHAQTVSDDRRRKHLKGIGVCLEALNTQRDSPKNGE